jgi:hypothetical protein
MDLRLLTLTTAVAVVGWCGAASANDMSAQSLYTFCTATIQIGDLTCAAYIKATSTAW